jgi:3-methylfumaryl-CoA hydratase
MNVEQRLEDWIGRETVSQDVISPGPLRGLLATTASMDVVPQLGSAAPLLAHWLYFLARTPQSELGPDGHAKRGGYLPPVHLPRRMWAGGRLNFIKPMQVGASVTRRSIIADIQEKKGKTGSLVFVRVDHTVNDQAGEILRESHDIVYRDLARPQARVASAVLAPNASEWTRRVDPDPVLLFRYSALTFNAHRIHYDRRYATEIEGYPGLIVHGPLVATLLLHELVARRPSAEITSFTFRAVRPIFDDGPFFVCGSEDVGLARLYAKDKNGIVCMEANATVR